MGGSIPVTVGSNPWFDDSLWNFGQGAFGYGNGNEVTPINTNIHRTAYFRQHFNVTNVYAITNLTLMVRRDDGIIVYLNGYEVLRDNLPGGDVSHTTPAWENAQDDGMRMLVANIQPHWLQHGTNLLAAEVHQSLQNTNDDDLTFDARLVANAETPRYTQVFPPGQTAFLPQLMHRPDGVRITELLPNVPPFTTVFFSRPGGFDAVTFDPDFGWEPGDVTFYPGQGAILMNPGPTFYVDISGLPPSPPRPIHLVPDLPVWVGRQAPGPATFEDIVGMPPENGTEVTRLVDGQPGPFSHQGHHVFINGEWRPKKPVAKLGEAVEIKVPCLYVGTPPNMIVEADSPAGAVVNFTLEPGNRCGGFLVVTSTPPSGSVFALGTHLVVAEIRDDQGRSNSTAFAITVRDTIAPEIVCSNLEIESTNNSGATVHFNPAVQDQVDTTPGIVCTPPSGSHFPKGVSFVRCVAWDDSGNTNECTFKVRVADTRPPHLTCPSDVTILRTWPEGAELAFQVIVMDGADTNLTYEYSMPPGSMFGPGKTRVDVAVSDSSGNRSTCAFEVHVIDPQPGRISGIDVDQQTVSLSFQTEHGVEYQIEYKNSLDEPYWQPLMTIHGNGHLMTIVDPEPSATMRFYRARSP